jgi:hypothetical protein
LKFERLEIKMNECNLKLENMADLKIQMKQIEENNLKYIVEIINLEEVFKLIIF